MYRFIFACMLSVLLFAPAAAFAQTTQDSVPLTNPIGWTKDNKAGSTNIPVFVGTAIKQVLRIVGAVAFAVFVFGGFLWLTSAGNTDRVKQGSETMLWAAIGICIIFASYAILQFVITALTS